MKTLTAIAAALLLSCSLAMAQQVAERPATNVASSAPGSDDGAVKAAEIAPVIKVRSSQQQHKFFDVKNTLAAGALAAGLAGDAWSTQRALAYPGAREANPIARPFVSTRSGQAVYSGASFGLLMGGTYLAHKTNHHKLERAIPFAVAGWEMFLTGWNLHQISHVR